MIRSFLMLLLLLAITAVMIAVSWGAQVKLSWNPNPESNIAGYELHVGTSSAVYAPPISTGNVTTYTVRDVNPGSTYYFALNAVATDGLKSDLSAELAHTVLPETPHLSREGWEVFRFSSQEIVREAGAATNAIDAAGIATYWNSDWNALPPHYLAICLPKPALVSSLEYTPWQGKVVDDAYIQAWSVQSSMDGITWEDWANGTWPNTRDMKSELLPLREIRYVRLWGNERYASASELMLRGNYVPDPPAAMVRLTMQQSENFEEWNDLDHPAILAPKKAADYFRIKIEPTKP